MTKRIFRSFRIKYITLEMVGCSCTCHDTRYAGHLGVRKTTKLILRDFYWPTVQANVAAYVATCEECQRNKPSNLRPTRLLQPLEVPGHRWETISIVASSSAS